MPYAPGITDRSGEIRAQGMLQGGMGLLRGVEQGVEIWKKNKEEEKQLQGAIKATESLIQAMGPIASQISPEFDKALKDLSVKVTDPALSTRERASLSQNALKGIGDLMGTGIQLKQMQAQEAQRKAVSEAQIAADKARMQNELFKSQVGAGVNAVLGAEGDRQQAIMQLPPQIRGAVLAEVAKMAKDTTYNQRSIGPGGVMIDEAINPIMGTRSSVPVVQDGVIVTMPQGGGPFGQLANAAQGGGLPANVIPGSRAARDIEKEQREMATAEEAKAATAQDLKSRVESTLTNVNDAIRLVRGGAGGPIQGMESVAGVANVGWGGESKQLINRISSIKAALRFINLQAIRQASKTGGAVGNLSNEEGRALESDIAALDPTLDEKEQEVLLQRIGEKLAKVGKVAWKPESPQDKSAPRDSTGKGKARKSDDILGKYGL